MSRERSWLDPGGGHLAADLVNTVSWRGDPARRVDHLTGAAALTTWTAAMGLPPVQRAPARELAALRELREALAALIGARAAGAAEPAAAAAFLRAAARDAVASARLDLDRGDWTVDVRGPASLRHHLALAAVDLLAAAPAERLRVCADDACGWVFLDASRSGTRRWCDPAGCGNRARARRHYARARHDGRTRA